MLPDAGLAGPVDDRKPPPFYEAGRLALEAYEGNGAAGELENAVAFLIQAVALTAAEDPRRADILNALGFALQTRFERAGQPADLDQAIARLEEAIALTTAEDPRRATVIGNLGNALQRRFDRVGRPADLQQAIGRLEEAVVLTAAGDPQRAGCLGNLGGALQTRFDRFGQTADLEQAIARLEEAVAFAAAEGPGQANALNNLGLARQRRFERFGQAADLDQAIGRLEEAVALTATEDPRRAAFLGNLGNVVQTRFERFGRAADLEQAIARLEEAVALTAAEDSRRAVILHNLGNAWQRRFERFGQAADLDQAVIRLEEAAAHTPAEDQQRAGHLSSLGVALSRRFERSGQPEDIGRAVRWLEEAVALTAAEDLRRTSFLCNLGTALQVRFRHFGQEADIGQAVARLEEALALAMAEDPQRTSFLCNLGNTLLARFRHFGQEADIGQAVARLEEAVALTTADDPGQVRNLNNLGSALLARFQRFGQPADIGHAVACYAEALALVVETHPLERMVAESLRRCLGLAALHGVPLSELRPDRPEIRLRVIRALRTADPDTALALALDTLALPALTDPLRLEAARLGLETRDVSLRLAPDPVGRTFSAWGIDLDRLGPAGSAAALALGRLDEAVLLADRGQAAVAGRLATGSLDLVPLLRDSRTRGEAALFQAAQRAVAGLLATARQDADAVPPDSLHRAWAELDRATLALRRTAGRPWLGRTALTGADLREAAAAAGAPLVHLLPLETQGLAIVTRPEEGPPFAIPLPDLRADAAERVLADLRDLAVAIKTEESGTAPGIDRRTRALCDWLDRAVLTPLAERLGTDRPRILVPTGALSGLPLLPAHRGPVALAGSAAAVGWAATSWTGGAAADGPVDTLLIAPPDRDLVHGRTLASLLPTVPGLAPPAVVGKGSVAAALEALREPRRLIVCWGHGEVDPAAPSRCGLRLAGGEAGLLSVDTMLQQVGDLRGAVVLLAACDGGRVAEDRRAEALGLPLAFIRLGAAAVVSPAWPVREAPTLLLMDRLIRALAAGTPVAAALARVQGGWAAETAEDRKAAYAALMRHHPIVTAGFANRLMRAVGGDRPERVERLIAPMIRPLDFAAWENPKHWAAFAAYGNPNAVLRG